jgi:hypothetical protein
MRSYVCYVLMTNLQILKQSYPCIYNCKQGIFKWSDVAKQFTVAKRSGKQCKERWMNHLDPNLKKHPWTHDEDLQLLEAQRRLGNSWTKIALEIDGRG